LLALRNCQLIGKPLICIGDDDLVSIGTGLLLRELFPAGGSTTRIAVVDIDERFLSYIRETAQEYQLPVVCYAHDLRKPLPVALQAQFCTAFTDPPYTLPGLALFLSRALEALTDEDEQVLFLSFAHKPSAFLLTMHQQILGMGLVPVEIIPSFNRYEGAEIIGNQSQMLVLKTANSLPAIRGEFTGLLYTGEIRRTVRMYQCAQCRKRISVGQEKFYATIEQLKQVGCPQCQGGTFDLMERSVL